ncbi:NAD(P)-binding domain-containing protein [Streptomyces sp. DSM 41524]|uniref:NAD(P)-binding domain-containing protein n=1 Tax=Streptomyces asiaticus subsp. ignotus TaxID=3098222 RepID=A0ABU7Q9W1_9ACTN|nr:NAD(P)-binding domain-containing protein [Streptomyces sp. DSM 41524]
MPGAGAIAQAIARHAIRHGHEVVLSNSRGASLLGPAGQGSRRARSSRAPCGGRRRGPRRARGPLAADP